MKVQGTGLRAWWIHGMVATLELGKNGDLGRGRGLGDGLGHGKPRILKLIGALVRGKDLSLQKVLEGQI